MEDLYEKYKSTVDELGLRGRSEEFLRALLEEDSVSSVAMTLFPNVGCKKMLDIMEFLYYLKEALRKKEADHEAAKFEALVNPSPTLLNVRRRVISKAFKALNPKIPAIREFFHQQDQRMTLLVVRTIEMDRSELTDYDMEDILYVIKTYFDPSRFDGKLVINLSSNKFGDSFAKNQIVYEAFCACLRELLALPQVEFVDISGNPLISLEHKAFFKTFRESDEATFLKMIWVDAYRSLETGEWKRLIRSESLSNMSTFTTLEHKIMASHGEYLSRSAKKE